MPPHSLVRKAKETKHILDVWFPDVAKIKRNRAKASSVGNIARPHLYKKKICFNQPGMVLRSGCPSYSGD